MRKVAWRSGAHVVGVAVGVGSSTADIGRGFYEPVGALRPDAPRRRYAALTG